MTGFHYLFSPAVRGVERVEGTIKIWTLRSLGRVAAAVLHAFDASNIAVEL